MLVVFLFMVLFVLVFVFVQTIAFIKLRTTPVAEAKKQLDKVKDHRKFKEFILRKQITLKKQGANIFLKDNLTVSQWYLYKGVIASGAFMVGMFITGTILKSEIYLLMSVLVGMSGWFFLDLFIRLENKSSNEAMMSDITEMSRSVLYGKRGGQYIADALCDAVVVVENKRLKTALIRLKNGLESGKSIDEGLDELELSFTNGEIAAFCTVIKSLQTTGQVDEALKTLETNITREEVSVNKRRCVMLENKTMMYVMLIAFDILAVILYCIIMKLLDMQIAF